MHALAMSASLVAAGYAEDGYADEDVQLWTRMEVRARLSPRVYIGSAQYLRFDSDVQRVAQFMPELYVGYSLTPLTRVALAYRAEYRRRPDDFRESHRFHLDLHARTSDSGPRLAFRLRLQPRWTLQPRGDVQSQFTARQRLGAYFNNDSPLTPAATVALFVRWPNDNTAFNKIRLTYELVLRVEEHRFLLGYRVDYPLNRPNPVIDHIMIFRYRVELAVPE